MYSKFVLAIRFCSAEMAILVGKWLMADCYFKLCKLDIIHILNTSTITRGGTTTIIASKTIYLICIICLHVSETLFDLII